MYSMVSVQEKHQTQTSMEISEVILYQILQELSEGFIFHIWESLGLVILQIFWVFLIITIQLVAMGKCNQSQPEKILYPDIGN